MCDIFSSSIVIFHTDLSYTFIQNDHDGALAHAQYISNQTYQVGTYKPETVSFFL